MIPFRLIYGIKIRWTQKIALSCSLCLTILTIGVTITRISGIHTGRTVKSIDSVWETYWQFIAANLALILTTATAFRTFFVSKVKNDRAFRSPSETQAKWYTRAKYHILSLFTSKTWRSKRSSDRQEADNKHDFPMQLPRHIPRGTITGIQTFIDKQGKTGTRNSQVMHSMMREENDDAWPLSVADRHSYVSDLERNIPSRSGDAH